MVHRRIHVAWVALLAGCTAPSPVPEQTPAKLIVWTEAGRLDWTTDRMSPARIRFSVTLFGPSVEVHQIKCDFAWNEKSINSAPLEDQCTGDIEFEVDLHGMNNNLSSSHEDVGLWMTLPNHPTHVVLVGEYESAEKPSFRKFGTISWSSDEKPGDIRWY